MLLAGSGGAAGNLPRNHVVKAALYQLAQNKPKHISQLRQIEDLPEKSHSPLRRRAD